jgi:Cu+-exporting ATPase
LRRCWYSPQRITAVIILSMIVFTLIMALGRRTPLYRLLYDYLPMYGSFRGTVKFFYITVLFIALLAGRPAVAHPWASDAVEEFGELGDSWSRGSASISLAFANGGETLLARIVAMVAQAQRSKAPIQKLADKVSAWFVLAVLAIAAATFAAWAIWGPEPRLAHGLVNAVAVLIIACPCALGLATPMSIMVAMGRGAAQGILFRSSEAIELLRRVDTLVVDKTGTLTAGKPALTSFESAAGVDGDEALALAAGLEAASEHPLADAVVAGARQRGVRPRPVESFEAIPG